MSAQPISGPGGTASVDAPEARAVPTAPRAGAARRDPNRGTGSTPSGRPAARPRLWLVPAPRRAPRAPFVVVLLALLLVGLVGLLLLNTASAQDAFRLSALQRQQQALELQRQELAHQADALGDPFQLEAKALTLGMIPVGAPIFLAPGQPLPKGAVVVGDGIVVVPAPLPPWSGALEAIPSAPASAKPSLKAAPKPSVTQSPAVQASRAAKPSAANAPSAAPRPSAAPTPASRPSARTTAVAPPALKRTPAPARSVRAVTPAAPLPAPVPAPPTGTTPAGTTPQQPVGP